MDPSDIQTGQRRRQLLTPGDPAPVVTINQAGSSAIVLIGDHAGRAVPQRLAGLGVPSAAMETHIAWDIGVAALGALLADALDAPFIAQTYSRLVIDCNRRPGETDSVPPMSDGVAIAGNVGLRAADVEARLAEIYGPYQAAIAAALEGRAQQGRPTVLVSLHSFTPVFQGHVRPWRYGVLHRGDSDLSRGMLKALRAALGDAAGDNQPYAMDPVDNTVPLHADPRSLDYLELEVRQDLIADPPGQGAAAAFITRCLGEAMADFQA